MKDKSQRIGEKRQKRLKAVNGRNRSHPGIIRAFEWIINAKGKRQKRYYS